MDLKQKLLAMSVRPTIEKVTIVDEVISAIESGGYTIVEIEDKKPWGAYFRMDNDNADKFLEEFFPGLDPVEARLGNDKAELSPKILLVSPSQRLSWQYHDRRAERWAFLNSGGYHKSSTDDQGEPIIAQAGDVVQFARGERHRLVGVSDAYTLVAEIWQHVDVEELSNEDDIIRLDDDYKR